ncbi:peptidylprolyl isomerase [Mesorhizobium sp. VK9D]|uniref:peptidylprolyl isomerase n=1 Tax=Mesorhizobium australafricanum TaxID=3072311 RepID=UPI002A23AFD1|nr:peptidylprolyl isomerase [Mesorhizobium sp. VK9D]MDX8451620.1 peptidylprolyl isomerase [Mesorhizobium sp. VK9D]
MKLLREPLLHFLVIGAAIFGAFYLIGADKEAASGKIVVSAGQIASMRAIFSRTWQREPTVAETDALVKDYIRDEVLYREAIAMGLDKDDAIIRRRMRQKMEFVADLTAQAEPTDAELKSFVTEHADWFRAEPRFSFSQVFFRSDSGGGPGTAGLERLLQSLNAGTTDASQSGDPFMAGFDFKDVAASDVARTFGESFASRIAGAGSGKWEGPVISAYGMHLVRVSERIEAHDPPFEDVREAARREWLHARKIAANDAFYEKLRTRYTIKVEAAPVQPGTAKVAEVAQ